jgi:hypothetical protein
MPLFQQTVRAFAYWHISLSHTHTHTHTHTLCCRFFAIKAANNAVRMKSRSPSISPFARSGSTRSMPRVSVSHTAPSVQGLRMRKRAVRCDEMRGCGCACAQHAGVCERIAAFARHFHARARARAHAHALTHTHTHSLTHTHTHTHTHTYTCSW